MPDVPTEKRKLFLNESIFQHPLFTGQTSNLFSPEAEAFKKKLADILRDSYSLENLNFLEEIYDLNQKRDLSKKQYEVQLKKIENKYITSKSINELNINPDTLAQIRSSSNKSLSDYKGAIKEVFDLISHNVTSHSTELIHLDKLIVMNKEASYLAEEFEKIIQTPVKKSSRLFLPKDEATFIDCQNACAVARENLLLFTTKTNTVKTSLESDKQEFTSILNKVIETLSRNYKTLVTLEKDNKNIPVRSSGIEAMIATISAADKRVNNTAPTQKPQRKDSPIIKAKSILPPIRGSRIFQTTHIKDNVTENPNEDSSKNEEFPTLKRPTKP